MLFLGMVVLNLVIIVLLVRSVRVLAEGERIVIERLGRFQGAFGPGLVFLMPVFDRGTRINLDREFPGWRSMTTAQLAERIAAWWATRPPSPPLA